MDSNRKNGAIGISAILISTATILIMSELRSDGYNHFHKAVSELGSLDAPNKWIFNILGYIVPGILISIFSLNLLKEFRSVSVKEYPFYLFASSGVLMAIAGLFPADMDNKESFITVLHTIGSFGGGLLWFLCALTLWWQLKKREGWRTVAMITFLIPFVMILLMSFVPKNTPGISQRIAFFANYIFIFLIAIKQLGESRKLISKSILN